MKSITRFTNNLHGNRCLNCDSQISEENNFCPVCGQVNDMNRISLKQYFSEYLAGFYSFDNRFIKTIVPLVLKPGLVSKNYVEGKRMRYVNPFQLYLHITILFFLVLGIFSTIDQFQPGSDRKSEILKELNTANPNVLVDSVANRTLEELRKNKYALDSTETEVISRNIMAARENLKTSGEDSLSMEDKITRIKTFAASLIDEGDYNALLSDPRISAGRKDSVFEQLLQKIDREADTLIDTGEQIMVDEFAKLGRIWELSGEKQTLKREAFDHLQELWQAEGVDYKIPKRYYYDNAVTRSDSNGSRLYRKVKAFMAYEKENPDTNVETALADLGYPTSYANVFLYSKSKDWNTAETDPEFWKSYLDRILSRVSVALFFLLPIFTLIVSLLYIRRKYNYTENLVFVFHVQTVFFILLMLFIILGRFVHNNAVIWIFLLLFMIYLYKALRKFYEQGRFKTLVKYVLLNVSFLVLALIGGVIISFIAFLI